MDKTKNSPINADNINFTVAFTASDFFQEIKLSLNCSYNSQKDGPINSFLPYLFESRFDDLSSKLNLLLFAESKIFLIQRKSLEGYDATKGELSLDKYLFDELQVYANYFVVEARSILEILEQINILIYQPKLNLPNSFNDLLKPRYLNPETLGKDYFEILKEVKESGWINELMSMDKSKKLAIRDIRTHFSHLYITPIKRGDKVTFIVKASRGAYPLYLKNKSTYELSEIVNDISKVIQDMITCFKKIYTAEFFAKLLLKRGYITFVNKSLQNITT